MLRNAELRIVPRMAWDCWIAGPVAGLVAIAICGSVRFVELFTQRFSPRDSHGVHWAIEMAFSPANGPAGSQAHSQGASR